MAIKHDPKWGKMDSDVPPSPQHKGAMIGCRIFFILCGTASCIASFPLMAEVGGGGFFLLVLGVICIVLGINVFSPNKEMEAWQKFHDEVEEEAKRKKDEEELKKQQQDELWKSGKWKIPSKFEEECKKNNIESVESEKDYQKAKLILENIMNDEGVPKQYQAHYLSRHYLGGQLRKIGSNKLNEQKQKLREKEEKLTEKNLELVDYIGAKKSITYCNWQIAMYKKELAECNANFDSVLNGGSIIYNTSKAKEKSWAIHGGIANGIAGPAAGISVAADIERKNQEIREYNHQLKNNIVGMQNIVLTEIGKMRSYAQESLEFWENKLSQVKVKLIEKLDENELLNTLSPEIVKVEQSITGSVLVHIKLFADKNLTIYDDVPAVVDGSIRVTIFADGEKVGSTLCGLPFEGVTYEEDLHIVCKKLSKRNKSYTAQISPHHLWAVEK